MLVFDYYAEFLSLKGYFTRKNFKIGFKKIHNIGKYFEKEMIYNGLTWNDIKSRFTLDQFRILVISNIMETGKFNVRNYIKNAGIDIMNNFKAVNSNVLYWTEQEIQKWEVNDASDLDKLYQEKKINISSLVLLKAAMGRPLSLKEEKFLNLMKEKENKIKKIKEILKK